MTPSRPALTIASNQGEVGGGEVMLLAIARAARELGHDVTVVGPASPSHVLDMARRDGFHTVAIPGRSARSYLRHLRAWDTSHRQGILWCNGLRPAFATAGRPNRIVHLHQLPSTKQKLFTTAARRGALTTLVPSDYLAAQVSDSTTMWNWTDDLAPKKPTSELTAHSSSRRPGTIGYIGRLSHGKGVHVLCAAVGILRERGHDVKLLLAGEARFVNDDEAAAVEAAIERLGEAAIRRGWMERSDFFSKVDLAVFPSTLPESFGLVAAEAMAARCPFVASDVGALPEIVGTDYPYLARPGDPLALADMLERALQDTWATQLDRSHARWLENFTTEAGTRRVARLLSALSDQKEA